MDLQGNAFDPPGAAEYEWVRMADIPDTIRPPRHARGDASRPAHGGDYGIFHVNGEGGLFDSWTQQSQDTAWDSSPWYWGIPGAIRPVHPTDIGYYYDASGIARYRELSDYYLI